jgi:hypothetical protein
MSSWSCPHEAEGICRRVSGAQCRPGMKGCVLCGKVVFEDGRIPDPIWPGAPAAPRREPPGGDAPGPAVGSRGRRGR